MSNINRVPLGLTGLTDSQTSGVVPDVLGRDISAVIDLTYLWAANLPWKVAELSAVIVGNANGASLTVPTGELWLVHQVSTVAQIIDVGGSGHFGVEVDLSRGGGLFTSLGQNPFGFNTAFVALDRRAASWTPMRPFLVPSGTAFRVAQYSSNAAAVNGLAHVLRVAHTPINT